QARDSQSRLAHHVARVGGERAFEELQQGGLAGAVSPQQAEPLAGVDLEADRIEQRGAREGEADIVEAQQRHGWEGLLEMERATRTRHYVRIPPRTHSDRPRGSLWLLVPRFTSSASSSRTWIAASTVRSTCVSPDIRPRARSSCARGCWRSASSSARASPSPRASPIPTSRRSRCVT